MKDINKIKQTIHNLKVKRNRIDGQITRYERELIEEILSYEATKQEIV